MNFKKFGALTKIKIPIEVVKNNIKEISQKVDYKNARRLNVRTKRLNVRGLRQKAYLESTISKQLKSQKTYWNKQKLKLFQRSYGRLSKT